jgi:cell division protein FtsN
MQLSRNAWTIIHQVYDTVHMALWALLVAGTVFLLLHIPQMRDAVATAKAQRVQEIAQENKLYCEKWGMRARTHEHIICTMDLNEIREKVAKRIAEDSAF